MPQTHTDSDTPETKHCKPVRRVDTRRWAPARRLYCLDALRQRRATPVLPGTNSRLLSQPERRLPELEPAAASAAAAFRAQMLSVDDLTDDLLLRVFVSLEEPRSLAAAEAVSPRWRCVVELGHERCWREACLRAWRLNGPQPSLRLPTQPLATPATLSAGWKSVLRDVYIRTSRAGGWSHARAKADAAERRFGANLGPALEAPTPGSTFALPAGLIGDEDGELLVENRDVVRLHTETPLGGDRAARCEAPFPWIRSAGPWYYTESPPAGLGMPLLERTVAGSSADHVLRRRQFHYYEVTIRAPTGGASASEPHAGAEHPCIAIGLATRSFLTNGKQPGWTRSSWGYHGDDGCIYHRNGAGTPWGPAFGTGDVVGCGLDCSLPCIWFTVNGRFVGISHDEHDDLHRGVRYFPVIGVDSRDEVELNTLGPFRFDLGRYQSTKDQAIQLWWRRHEQRQAQLSQARRRHGGRRDRGRCDDSHSTVQPKSAESQAGASTGATTNLDNPPLGLGAASTTMDTTNNLHYRREEQTDSILRALVCLHWQLHITSHRKRIHRGLPCLDTR